MSDPIDTALGALRRVISQQLEAERARTTMTMNTIIERLHSLVADLPRPSNDDDAVPSAAPVVVAGVGKPILRSRRSSLSDEAFLDCLTTEWIRGMIVMGFESALDAATFRASALNDCRAVIAANNARRRAQR